MNCTLIIGLGGAGSRITANIYQKFLDRNPSDEDREKLVCLCFDTDFQDINRSRELLPLEWVVKISPDLPLEAVYEQLKGVSKVQDWFVKSEIPFMDLTLNEGSGMSRMAARLAFLYAEAEGKLNIIDGCIEQLLGFGPDVDVHIICSFAGGTGSGIFLQTAFYVKEVLHRMGAKSCPVSGYFILANVFDVWPDYLERMRANTYASLKELNAFSLDPVSFEYRIGQQNLFQGYPPYDLCYMIDNNCTEGFISRGDRYDMLGEFVFNTIVSPIRDAGYQMTIKKIANCGERFSSFALSKLVYPVDDLFSFFARQQLFDMLATWSQFDKDYEQRFDLYKKNVREGVNDTEPDRGRMFMSRLQQLSYTPNGVQGVVYRHIYYSTQVLDEDGMLQKSKAEEYVNSVRNYVKETVDAGKVISRMYMQCMEYDTDFLKSENSESGLDFVVRRERELEDYRKLVLEYVDNTSGCVIHNCFLVDYEAEDNISKTPEEERHHLNSYILKKNDEMHPIAIRYFLYDIRDRIALLLDDLTIENKKLLEEIDNYKLVFDNPKTDFVESALDKVEQSRRETTILRKLLGKNPYKDAIKEYVDRSIQHAKNIKKYACDRLFENVLSGLLEQINTLIDQIEHLFDAVPLLSGEIDEERQWLLKKHDGVTGNTIYVLSSKLIKMDIYKNTICRESPFIFPAEISAMLYRLLYTQTYNVHESLRSDHQQNNVGFINDVLDIFKKDCLPAMTKILKENCPTYVNMNVIDALMEEGMRENDNDKAKSWEYIKQKFRNLRDLAETLGPNNLGFEVRYINTWELHPDCVDVLTISTTQEEVLFGNAEAYINPRDAATLLMSESFSKYEVVRVNTVYMLPISHFYGYEAAYNHHLTQRPNIPLHLDRNWQTLLPALD